MRSLILFSAFIALAVSSSSGRKKTLETCSCPDGSDLCYEPYPENCRKFKECSEDVLYILTCQADWLWREESDYCDYPENVECGDRPVCEDENDPDTCDEHHVSLPPTPDECPDFDCPADGFYEYAPCSPFFCHCANDHPYLEECDDGLVFNPDLGGCDWPESNPDCPP